MSHASSNSLDLILSNTPDDVSKAIHDFLVFCKEKNFSLAVVYKFRLAMEEILVNTISYSYPDLKKHFIKVKIRFANDIVTIEFVDDGIEFNPLTVPPPADVPLEERKPGGVGLYLVKTMMDTFEYQRKDGENIITISKKII